MTAACFGSMVAIVVLMLQCIPSLTSERMGPGVVPPSQPDGSTTATTYYHTMTMSPTLRARALAHLQMVLIAISLTSLVDIVRSNVVYVAHGGGNAGEPPLPQREMKAHMHPFCPTVIEVCGGGRYRVSV